MQKKRFKYNLKDINMNLSLIEGKLVENPKMFYTQNGISICKFTIAVRSQYKSNDKIIEDLTLINVDTYRKVAEACMLYLKKSDMVKVKGRLKQIKYIKNDETKTKIMIEASNIDFLSKLN
jgi:single-strand DNA-binding protein